MTVESDTIKTVNMFLWKDNIHSLLTLFLFYSEGLCDFISSGFFFVFFNSAVLPVQDPDDTRGRGLH